MTEKKSKQLLANLKFGIIFQLIFISFSSSAQLLNKVAIDTATTYNIEEALQQDPLKVYQLSLKKSKLTQIPEVVYQFKNLNILKLNNNKIVDFPVKITEFKYLQILDLSSNKLVTLPKELRNLTNLKKLYLHQNKISKIPSEVKHLKKLEFIALSGNEISNLPFEIRILKDSLKKIEMWQVPISKKSYKAIKLLLPNTKIKYSKACDCD